MSDVAKRILDLKNAQLDAEIRLALADDYRGKIYAWVEFTNAKEGQITIHTGRKEPARPLENVDHVEVIDLAAGKEG